MSSRNLRWVALAAAVSVSAVLPVAGSSAETAERKAKFVRVGDDFFSPSSTRVPRRKVITWVWGNNDNAHNVRLRQAPAGVDRGGFRSATKRRNYRFSRRLRKPGRYVFVCSLHAPGMRMVVRVRR